MSIEKFSMQTTLNVEVEMRNYELSVERVVKSGDFYLAVHFGDGDSYFTQNNCKQPLNLDQFEKSYTKVKFYAIRSKLVKLSEIEIGKEFIHENTKFIVCFDGNRLLTNKIENSVLARYGNEIRIFPDTTLVERV